MEQEKFELWMMDYLSGELDENQQIKFENYLKDHPSHREEFEKLSITWNEIDQIEVPELPKKMDATFFEMLNTQIEKKESTGSSWLLNLKSLFDAQMKLQLAYGMIVLTLGLITGYYANNSSEIITGETIISSNAETEEVREQLVLTLLEQPSANKRLQGMNEAAKLNDANERIIEALFTTLNKDQNINVRLVAMESLAKYADTPEVRMGLVKSIALQDSPLVQIALADLMVTLQEKTSIDSMKQLLEKPDIDNTVKQKLEESINHII